MGSTLISLIAAAVSAAAALASVWFTRRGVVAERLAVAETLAVRFREPVLQAAFNLQSRIYNILRQSFLDQYMSPDRPDDEREYASENTLYLLGQYFCWVEILRRESQFLDPRNEERNRVVAQQLEVVRDAFASSEVEDPVFRLFRGEQRAIGEVMLAPTEVQDGRYPRWDCIGYAAFIRKMSDGDDRWFRRTRADLQALARDPANSQERMVRIQHALLELVNILDPAGERVSMGMRSRL